MEIKQFSTSINAFLENRQIKSHNVENAYNFLKNTIIRIYRVDESDTNSDSDIIFIMKNSQISKKNQETRKELFLFEEIKKSPTFEHLIGGLISILQIFSIQQHNFLRTTIKDEIFEIFKQIGKIVVIDFIYGRKNNASWDFDNKSLLFIQSLISTMNFKLNFFF